MTFSFSCLVIDMKNMSNMSNTICGQNVRLQFVVENGHRVNHQRSVNLHKYKNKIKQHDMTNKRDLLEMK